MVIRTASPSVNINEVDLTRGTIDAISTNVGAIVGPFEKGPVDQAVLISTESELQRVFGNPTEENYEYWWTVNNFLEYGGVCYVIRCDDAVGDSSGTGLQRMKNAADVADLSGLGPYIKNLSDFTENFQWGTTLGGATDARFIANSPGEWGNNIGIAVIDRGADYQVSLRSTDVTVIDSGVPAEGIFGDAVSGSVNTVSMLNPGTGFASVAPGDVVTFVGPSQTATLQILATDDDGPVSSLGPVVTGGAGYRDAQNLQTTGGSGTGLTVDILANDNGPATGVSITSAVNNYRFTLLSAGLDTSAINVALTTTASGIGTGAVIIGAFTSNRLTDVRVSAGLGGSGYKVGEILTITQLNGTAIDILDSETTLEITSVNITGEVTSVSLRNAGDSYKIGDRVTILQSSSTNPATVEINSVECTGAIKEFTVFAAGEDYEEGDLLTVSTPQSTIIELDNLVPGTGYTPGVYNSVPFNGGSVSARNAVGTIVVGSTGEVETVIVTDGGWGYISGDVLTAPTGVLGTGTGFSIEVSITDSVDAQFRVSSANPAGSKLPSGTPIGLYYKIVAPSGLDLDVSAFFEECESDGTILDATGHIISYGNGAYKILVTGGLPSIGQYITNDGGTTRVGPITAAYPMGHHLLYDVSDNSNYVISTIFEPQRYTKKFAFDEFGWSEFPRNGEKSPVSGAGAYGDTFVYDSTLEVWTIVYELQPGDLLADEDHVYQVNAVENWYDQQIAYQGVPWYRFAPRPLTSRYALERGASGDGINILVYDATGDLSGSRGNILESYVGVSKLSGAKTVDGENNYYIDVINQRSSYIWANKPLSGSNHNLLNESLREVGSPIGDGVESQYINCEAIRLSYGENNLSCTLGELQFGYNKFAEESFEDLDYILQGPGLSNLQDSVAKANFIVSIVEDKKSCMAFLSPPRSAVVGRSDSQSVTDSILEWAKEIPSSSYTVLDSGYKYSYDRFNDTYRYMPLNGDIAGKLVDTAINFEPWESPGGVTKGQIYNVVNLPYNPNKQQRDQLYANRVNPVVTFPGEGTILYGDKTALSYTSAFDRINVRRLFLVVQKAIAEASRSVLFQLNDEITRSLFKNNVNPYLRDVQSKRGMSDFLVVCDSSNNGAEIIDRNEFIADIYIKPTRSINYIRLNFVATKTGVTFDESVALFRGTNGAIRR